MSVLSGRHGYYNTSVYNLWRNIIKRCEDANCEQYQWYGGRGIRMDDVWRKNPKAFCDWVIANGYRKGMEIDRKDVNGNYNPENCHFIANKHRLMYFICAVLVPKYGGVFDRKCMILAYDWLAEKWACEDVIVTHWRYCPEPPKEDI